MSARRNLELKAVDPEPADTLRRALAAGAREERALHQRDTYFHAVQGRLKLRETAGEMAELISYARADRPDARISTYRVVPVLDADALYEALKDALGVRAVVEKRRRLLLHGSTRVHLDAVDGLGDFVELEQTERDERAVEVLREALGITPDRLVARGYADMLERRGGTLVPPRREPSTF